MLPNSSVFGPLSPLVEVPDVTDIIVTSGGQVWLDDPHGLRQVPLRIETESEVRSLAVELVAAGGRHLDYASPIADVRVDPCYRVHAVIPPVAAMGTEITIRIQRRSPVSVHQFGSAGEPGASRLRLLQVAVADRENLLISGPTGSGKTTLVGALLSEVPASERIIILEDVREIVSAHPHLVRLEVRQANTDGRGAVTLSDLVRASLRMRPDRIVLGECRGPEVADLLSALNTGHAGSMATVHANSLQDVPSRLTALGQRAGLSPRTVASMAVSAISWVAFLSRNQHGRHVSAVGRLRISADGVSVEEVDHRRPQR